MPSAKAITNKIRTLLQTYQQRPELNNAHLIQLLNQSDALDVSKIVAFARQRQHRNASKLNYLWFRGRNTQIVQPIYDYIVKQGEAFQFNLDFLKFLQGLEPKFQPNAPVDDTKARECIQLFASLMKNNLRGSSGMKILVQTILEHQDHLSVTEIVAKMRAIATTRQTRCWSKLSIFGHGRDTEIIQPLYDLMASPNFNLDALGIEKLKNILALCKSREFRLN